MTQDANPYRPLSASIEPAPTGPARSSLLLKACSVLVLLHGAWWASRAPFYVSLMNVGQIAVLHFLALALALLCAALAGLRVLLRCPPPVLPFALASLFGLVAVVRPVLWLEWTGLGLSIAGTVLCMASRRLAKAGTAGRAAGEA